MGSGWFGGCMASLLILKLDTLYAACSPEAGVVTYGHCQDEAVNNLTDEIARRQDGDNGAER